MVQPFRITDQDDPGQDRGGWGENGDVDITGTLTVDRVKGSQSSAPSLTTVQFLGLVEFAAEIVVTAGALISLFGATDTESVLGAGVTGDAFDRFRLRADGQLAWGPGAGARDTTLARSGAAALSTPGFFGMGSGQSGGQFSVFGGAANTLRLGTAGAGVAIAEGTNARMGVATLVAGTVVVANTSVTANTRVFLSSQSLGGTPGAYRVGARTPGTSFTITSTQAADTSVVAYLLMEPA